MKNSFKFVCAFRCFLRFNLCFYLGLTMELDHGNWTGSYKAFSRAKRFKSDHPCLAVKIQPSYLLRGLVSFFLTTPVPKVRKDTDSIIFISFSDVCRK